MTDLQLIADLRLQLERSRILERNMRGERDRAQTALAALRDSLTADAEHADIAHEQRSSAWWHAMWREQCRRTGHQLVRIAKLEKYIDATLSAAAKAIATEAL